MTLNMIGWQAIDAFRWKNHLGQEVLLTMTSPAMLRNMMVAAYYRSLEQCVAAKLQGTATRLSAEPIKRLVNYKSSKLS